MNRNKLVYFDRWADQIAVDILSVRPEIELCRVEHSDIPENIWSNLSAAHGYQWPRPPYVGSAGLIARCPQLLAMSSQGSGCDVMDIDACTEAGILVVNQAGLGGRDAAAVYTIGVMISLLRNIARADKALRSDRDWDRLDFKGGDLFGMTLGIIGFGQIGRRIGEICHNAFAMRILACDPRRPPQEIAQSCATKVTLQELLVQSDFVSLNCPLNAESRNLMAADQFEAMKPGAFFIATSRGGTYDEVALADALRAGRLSGAGVDVWEVEPPSVDHPLLQFDNVIATPHMAALTDGAYRTIAEGAALQWIEIFAGNYPPRLVNKEVWPRYAERFRSITGRPVAAQADTPTARTG